MDKNTPTKEEQKPYSWSGSF